MNTAQPPVAAPLNLAQLGVVKSSAQVPTSADMTMAVAATIRPAVDPDAFARACRLAEADLEGTRVVVVPTDDGWVQRVDDSLPRELDVVDLRAEPDAGASADRALRERAGDAVPLTGEVAQVRNHLFLVSEQESRWLICAHHAVADGVSGQILRQRIVDWYGHLVGAAPEPAPLNEPAARAWALGEPPAASEVLQAWREALGELPDRMVIAATEGTLGVPAHKVEVRLDAEQARAFAAAGGGRGWTHAATALLAAYTARVTCQPRVVLGFVTAGRVRGTEQAFTMVARIVPMALDVPRGALFPELATQARNATRRLRELGAATAEELRAAVPAAWRLGRVHGPVINLIPFETEIVLPGHEVFTEVVNRGPVDDLHLVVTPAGDGLMLELRANGLAYTAQETDRHARRLAALATALGADPGVAPLDVDPAVADDVEARALLAARTGERVVDAEGRPGLVGEPGEVVGPDGTPTGRLACLRPDGTLDDLGPAADAAVLGGHLVVPVRLQAHLLSLPGVAGADVRVTGRRVAALVLPEGGCDADAVVACAQEALAALLPPTVRCRVALAAQSAG